MGSVTVGFIHSLIRKEEKLLLHEFEQKRNVSMAFLDDRELQFGTLDKPNVDVVIERSINHSRALYALRFYQSLGVSCVNRYAVAETCGDKILTAACLTEQQVAQPEYRVAFTEQSALQAIEELGYPVVLKPAVGSWGRLLSKINDRDAAEALLEHKVVLGSYHHAIFFVQQYLEKRGRDIRAFVIGDECIAAIYRNSEHWITNTARGATVSNCIITAELEDIAVRAAQAVGGGVLAVDLFETDAGLLVNEVNHTMEFRNSIETTGVNIAEKVVSYVVSQGRANG